jgi:hypothetical protein
VNLALLQYAQELRLELGRKLADLVEQQRSVACRAKQSLARGHRPRERALGVAEQLALDQLGAERRAVHGQEGAGPSAQAVQLARDVLFAGTGLADEEHGGRIGAAKADLLAQPSY